MKVAVVGGTGKQGSGLVLRLAAAGHDVMIGSRDAARAAKAAAEARAHLTDVADASVRGSTSAGAVEGASLVFLTVPHAAQAETLRGLRAALVPPTILVTTTNPIAEEAKQAPGSISAPQENSAAEEAAGEVAAGVRVVAGFQSIAAAQLRDLARPVEGDVLLCGNDADAKAIVGSLVKQIPNLRWIDAGELSMARAVERLTGLLISVNRRYGVKGATVRLEGHPTWGAPG